MSFKDRIINVIKTHPNLVMFGIGLAIALIEHGQTAFGTQTGEHGQTILS